MKGMGREGCSYYILFIKINQLHQDINLSTMQAKGSKSAENTAFEKISSFITRFYAVLLPKANDQGAYRDLSEEQQYLLNSLDSESPLHSILAGCLAIDSCLSNITQAQQNSTDNILKSLTTLCTVLQRTQNELVEGAEAKNISVLKVEQLWKKVEESTRNLIVHCHDLPFSQENEQLKKQQKIMSQQDITFKISSLKLFEEEEPETNKENLQQLQQENTRLQEQLTIAQKKLLSLESKISKMQENAKGNDRNDQISKQKNIRKYSQTAQQKDGDVNNWPHFTTPSSTNTIQQKEIQSLRQQTVIYEKTINHLRQQFRLEKKKMMREIRTLEDQLRMVDAMQDRELVELLQELEDQIESLRQERRHDERIIGQIQQKLEGMNISKSRISRGIRGRQNTTHLKYSRLFKDRQLGDDISQIEGRNPSFKKSRMRDRIYTSNDQVSRSSISMPKIQDYNYDQERRRFQWKTEKNRPMRDYQRYEYPNDMQVKYNRQLPRPIFNPNYRHPNTQDYSNIPPESNQKQHARIKSIYAVPLVESKMGRQSFAKPEQKNLVQYGKGKKNYDEQRKLPQGKYETRNDFEQNQAKASKWHQITNNPTKQSDPRLKTSRI